MHLFATGQLPVGLRNFVVLRQRPHELEEFVRPIVNNDQLLEFGLNLVRPLDRIEDGRTDERV
jgi:hypothetical protein